MHQSPRRWRSSVRRCRRFHIWNRSRRGYFSSMSSWSSELEGASHPCQTSSTATRSMALQRWSVARGREIARRVRCLFGDPPTVAPYGTRNKGALASCCRSSMSSPQLSLFMARHTRHGCAFHYVRMRAFMWPIHVVSTWRPSRLPTPHGRRQGPLATRFCMPSKRIGSCRPSVLACCLII